MEQRKRLPLLALSLSVLLAAGGCFLFTPSNTVDGVTYEFPRSYGLVSQQLERGLDDVERPTAHHRDGATAIGVTVGDKGAFKSPADLAGLLRQQYQESKYAKGAVFSDITSQPFTDENRTVAGARFTQRKELLGIATEVVFHIYVVEGATKEAMVLFVSGPDVVIDAAHPFGGVLRSMRVP